MRFIRDAKLELVSYEDWRISAHCLTISGCDLAAEDRAGKTDISIQYIYAPSICGNNTQKCLCQMYTIMRVLCES